MLNILKNMYKLQEYAKKVYRAKLFIHHKFYFFYFISTQHDSF